MPRRGPFDLTKFGHKETLKRIPGIVASMAIGLGLIVFGIYWLYYLYSTESISSGSTLIPILIIGIGAVLVYLPFEGIVDRRRGKKATPLPPPPP